METHVSSKGQITLPVMARKKLGLKTGDVLHVSLVGEDKVVLEKRAGAKVNSQKALEIIRETAGAWKEMQETGEAFTRRLRKEDQKRLEALGFE
ncbi:AbrB/MazE/SpoVT family DNA-binding domain-containing protein [Desulfofundulus thermocisternus]|uniref:AbrB/MazE/SpoVT family DNA-binding domain-containing protein n=1 Tax=Desulfofundulus thermocisternus TaxID=42471 RepID=UPI001A02C4EE|nr:AbrB/MazE/SpoVT family DNA-binding domain-containing protein [Desulfofundulus thermocisternus]MBE3586846.1 AbrB/MazE/SpoVT family DNA-binding domain-containing protein [Thermoanaerobacter sp.]MCS5695465.1 AbrB/MazE/SpoVT family DNA-binding domain-containing protein [Desulfofundulus thermocisternus]